MDKEIQRIAWNCLPKEFKEEVNRMWSVEVDCATKYKSELHKHRTGLLYELFGEHLHWQNNLTSDAEGEEMLTCEKSRVQQQYNRAVQLQDDSDSEWNLVGDQTLRVLSGLFGSKCLPDETANEDNFASKEPKPAEPKFKVRDKVRLLGRGDNKIDVVKKVNSGFDGCPYYYMERSLSPWTEDYLEPYTEPSKEDSATLHAESVKESRIASEESHLRNSSQETADCDKEFDAILKNGFREHNRLHIAAMAMQAIVSRGKGYDEQEVAVQSLAYADALIAESEKGCDV